MTESDDRDARRREDVARLRAAARSTTPEAYKVRPVARPAEPDNTGRSGVSSLFGAMTAGGSTRDTIATTMALGAQGIAYILLIVLLNLAQCSWWYEPGMYTDPEHAEKYQRIGR